ncbi:MAG: CoA transferase [Bacteroidota bacterium]
MASLSDRSDKQAGKPLRPLAGVRVVELGASAALAFGARLLSDLGAEVIKIEPPDGDPFRAEPPLLEPHAAQSTSVLFGYLNHGKRCVALDLVATEGRGRLIELAHRADLLLVAADSPQRVLSLPRPFGDANASDRPVVLALTPHGLKGERAGNVGSDFIAQHAGGYAYHQACPVSDTEAMPPAACADREPSMLVGLVVANAALWGLAAARPGAPKPFIDVSAEDAFAYLLVDALADMHSGALPRGRARVPGREITIAGGLVWLLPCSDGTILVSPREDHQWQRWLELMGHPAWSQDKELCGTRESRTRNARKLQELMAPWALEQKSREIFARAQAARVACFPVSTAEDLIVNPQLAARAFFDTLAGSGSGVARLPGLPFEMRASTGGSLQRGATTRVPPLARSTPDDEAAASRVAEPGFGRSASAGGDGKLPLNGVRVVDFSWVVAGPMATKVLGAMGAEIIKIESTTRAEFAMRDAWFSVINNNKKSCTLNITTAEGQALVRELVAKSDVVVENFSSRVLRNAGLGYEDLRKVKPDIIFVSASGLGRTGPERDLLAYGSLLQAYSGRVSMIGRMSPSLEAMGVMPAWTDPVTSLWETIAVLAALRHRWLTGEGAYIDLSMLEATVTLLPDAVIRASLGRPRAQQGSDAEIGAAPSGCFRCSGDDEWLALSVRTADQWSGLCHAIGRADLLARSELASEEGRLAAKAELDRAVALWCREQYPQDAWGLLQSHRVPSARSRGIYDLACDPHLSARGAFRELEDGSWTTTLPWMDQDGWRGRFTPTPKLGSHNAYVFRELLGLSASRVSELERAGVIR